MKTPQRTAGASLAGSTLAGASALATAGAVFAVLVVAALAVPVAAGADAAATAAGADVYKAQCVGCHGADGGAGTPIGKALKVQDLRRAEVQTMKDADLAAVIEKGKGKMPSFKGKLSAAQIGQVVEYIRTLAKAK
jgi:cytochrome c6